MTILLHVSAYLGNLQGGGYPREEWWLVMLWIYSYNIKIQVLNTIHDKIFKFGHWLRIFIVSPYLIHSNANKHVCFCLRLWHKCWVWIWVHNFSWYLWSSV